MFGKPAADVAGSISLMSAADYQDPAPPRTVVICIDGTWNNAEIQNTNVDKIWEMVDPDRCIRYYRKGIGTNVRYVSKLLGGATGAGTMVVARDALKFVQGNLRECDRLFIFGFSRGAYSARHLAAMVAGYGAAIHYEDVFRQYKQDVLRGHIPATAREVHFLGLFDCVNANHIYLLRKGHRNFNSCKLERGIKHFAHGVSRDERRWSYAPIFFEKNGQESFNQVWMPGYHFDVGGDVNPPLNSFALWWMLHQAFGCGLPLENVLCRADNPWRRHSRMGNAIGFVPHMNPAATGHPSDWITTRLGLTSPRPGRAGSERVGEMPDLRALRVCPRGCGEPMFDLGGAG